MALTQKKSRSPAKQGAAIQRSNAWIGSLALFLISTVISLILAEITFRVAKQLQWHRVVKWHQHELYTMLPDSPLEYGLHPDVGRENLIPDTGVKWSYRINSDGFRGADFPARGDNPRVLFVGDSYTFGWAIEEQETITEAVALKLMEPPYELVIDAYNLGVPGYNTVQEYHLLEQAFDRYLPDLVVLGYVMNDAEPQVNVPERPSVRYKYVTSWLLAFVKEQVNYYVFEGEQVLDTGLNLHGGYLLAAQENGAKWADGREAFAEMAALCNVRGVPFFVVIYPSTNKSFNDKYPFLLIHEEVSRWAAAQGVPAVDMLEYFWGKDHQEYRVKGDGHPAGLAFAETALVIAPIIYEYLQGSAPTVQGQ